VFVVAVLNEGVELEEICEDIRGLSVHTEGPFFFKTTELQTMPHTMIARDPLLRRVRDMVSYVGSTPLIQIEALSSKKVQVLAKAEWQQIGHSVKARAAYSIVRHAIETGKLDRSKSLLDASSGNTAIAYATILKELGLKATICLPSNASQMRIRTLRDLDVDLVLTSPFEGTEGAQERARQLYKERPNYFFYADQYSNPANWQAHYNTTAPEILEQTGNRITHFVAGLGTTGTFTGTSRRLRETLDIRLIALQPDGPMHVMEGWKHLETASVPDIYDNTLADDLLEISSEETYDMIVFLDKSEGLRLSPSAAANVVGAKKVADKISSGVIVTILPDSIHRYEEVEQELFTS
jgi:cysteine synthase B